MKSEEQTLVDSLLARPDRRADGLAALRSLFPGVADEMLRTAVHHLYGDGVDAAVAWLAGVERTLQSREHELCPGATFEFLYHVYNWLQIQSLLPEGAKSLSEIVAEVSAALASGEVSEARALLDELKERLDGDRTPPQLE